MSKFNIYEMITERIISALESGVIPWRKPWKSYAPMNYISKRYYHGINFLLLSLVNSPSPYFLTFKKVKELDGTINKGAKSHIAVFWKLTEYSNIDEVSPRDSANGESEAVRVPIIRYYRLFNLADTSLYKEEETPLNPDFQKADELLSAAEKMIQFRNNFNSCFYNQSDDFVSLPLRKNFESDNEYFASAFHELIHATGHESRLNRFKVKFESNSRHHAYSFEELVAEIGSAYLCALTGVDNSLTIENTNAYIGGWLQRLQNDKMFVYRAAAQAKKAVDYILQNTNINFAAA